MREFFHVALCEGSDDRALNHSRQNPGGVFDRLASAELNVACVQEKRLAAELSHAYFEGNTGASRGFREEQRPDLIGQRLVLAIAALLLQYF